MYKNLSEWLQREIEYRATAAAVRFFPYLRTACIHDRFKAATELPREMGEEIKAVIDSLVETGVLKVVER